MKKSMLALAVLGAFAGAAVAQSSVTLYGRVDLAVGKGVGTGSKALNNGSGSRLGFRGVEDLGGGTSAFFNIEHRFNADTGAMTDAARMFGGRSIVGLQGGFGKVTLGREYTTAFLGSQLVADPWGWDTVVSGTPGTGLNQAITGGGIARVRNDSSVTYNMAAAGFSFGAQIAEGNDTINTFQARPVNFAVGYAAGPLSLGFGYERTGLEAAATAKWTTINGAYNLGAVKLGAFYGTGNTHLNAKHKSYMFTAVAPMGQGELRASFGKLTADPAGAAPRTDAAKGFGLGYHYALSKRTTLYTDYVRNTAPAPFVPLGEKSGYDFGIKHNF
jgi:predicted porin